MLQRYHGLPVQQDALLGCEAGVPLGLQTMEDKFNISNFSYTLPKELIAQEPRFPRDSSRLLIVNRKDSSIAEAVFKDIGGFLKSGDLLVLNDTQVIKAKLVGKRKSGGKVDVLLVKRRQDLTWEVLLKRSGRVNIDEVIVFDDGNINARVCEKTQKGTVVLDFSPCDIETMLPKLGRPPLPHYIKKEIDDSGKYQTVYAAKVGAIAAPTAGFHFTHELLTSLMESGVEICYVTIHCGLATFRPVKTPDIRSHNMESEWIEISSSVENKVNEAKKKGLRVIAVGTTSIRALESAAFISRDQTAQIKSFTGETKIYITPGYNFKIIDSVITNFHTPCSTNLILVSGFLGLGLAKKAYEYAIKHKFRFFSFGDAMLVI